jgi:predicted type IV restriction endonuclease
MHVTAADISRESALSSIQGLRQEYGERAKRLASANEAQTRLLLVDRILQVLGWGWDDFNPETAKRRGHTDYLMTVDGRPRLVIEAKRVGHTFGFPRSGMLKTEYPLKYLRTAYGPPLTEVIEQAERYTLDSGVPFAALTNGAEWMLIQMIPSPGQQPTPLGRKARTPSEN